MSRKTFIILIVASLFCTAILPRIIGVDEGARKILLVVMAAFVMPMIVISRMAYLDWKVRDMVNVIFPGKGDKTLAELFTAR